MAKTWDAWLSFPAAVWGTKILGELATTCLFLTLSLPRCIPVPLISAVLSAAAKGRIPKDQNRERMEIRSVTFITKRYSERYTAFFFKIKLLKMSILPFCQNQLPTKSVVNISFNARSGHFPSRVHLPDLSPLDKKLQHSRTRTRQGC